LNYDHLKLKSGYAETSTCKRPREAEIVVVGEAEIASVRCEGAHLHYSGEGGWLRFKVRGKSRYYFQHQPY
jgi:hypothetical protein